MQSTVVWVFSLWRQPPAPGTGCMTNQLDALNRRVAPGMQTYQQQVKGGSYSVCPSSASGGRKLMSTRH